MMSAFTPKANVAQPHRRGRSVCNFAKVFCVQSAALRRFVACNPLVIRLFGISARVATKIRQGYLKMIPTRKRLSLTFAVCDIVPPIPSGPLNFTSVPM